MGLKLKSQLVAFTLLLTLIVCLVCIPFFVVFKLVFFTKSDLLILFISMIIYTYGVTMQTIFFLFATGYGGMLIFIILNVC